MTGDRFTVAQVVDRRRRHRRRQHARRWPGHASATCRATAIAASTVDQLPVGPAGRYRLVAVDADGPDGPLQVYVATSLEPADHAVAVWAVRLAAVLPLVVLLVGTVTWWGMGAALGPVEAMRAELQSIGADGRRRRVRVPSGAEEIVRLGTTMNDLLDRLAAASARQRQFAADASHELRSPLAAMRVQLEAALVRPDLADWAATAEDVLADQTRVEGIVRDLLLLARLDGAEPRHAEVDLAAIVADELDRSPAVPGTTIRRRLAPACRVGGDAEQLGRVVRNLLDNACRHADADVDVTLRAARHDVALDVVDDGPGIDPGDRERVFDRFVRLDDARARDAGGSGLGLAIAREIVHAHAGSIRVAERAGGTCLEVRLPRWPS